MSDYRIVRKVLEKEKRRREDFYRFRPHERAPAMQEINDALAAIDRMKKAGDWAGVAKFWQEKFD